MREFTPYADGESASSTPPDSTASGSANQTSPEASRKYTKGIINNLLNGIIPVFNSSLAGDLAPMVKLLLEDYDASDIPGFNAALDAVKIKYPEVRRLVEEEEITNPDYVISPNGRPMFRTMGVRAALNIPPVGWLVSGVLQESTTTLVVGTGNVGKTFIWLDACFDIAYGEKWLGRRTKQGGVLYIYAEGSGGLGQRVQAILQERGLIDPDGNLIGNEPPIYFIPRPVHLLNDRDKLYENIEALPELPLEVVIDTFSMCASGVEENSNTQVAQYLATASEIKLKYGCHVTIIHHKNKNGGFRGASALRDNVDTAIILDREDETSPISMTCDKQRDGAYFKPFTLYLKQVELGINSFTGEPITSCVVTMNEAEADAGGRQDDAVILSERQQKMMELLEVNGSLYSGQWEKKSLESHNIPGSSFNNYAKALVTLGLVIAEKKLYGKQTRVLYSLKPKDEPITYDQQELAG